MWACDIPLKHIPCACTILDGRSARQKSVCTGNCSWATAIGVGNWGGTPRKKSIGNGVSKGSVHWHTWHESNVECPRNSELLGKQNIGCAVINIYLLTVSFLLQATMHLAEHILSHHIKCIPHNAKQQYKQKVCHFCKWNAEETPLHLHNIIPP